MSLSKPGGAVQGFRTEPSTKLCCLVATGSDCASGTTEKSLCGTTRCSCWMAYLLPVLTDYHINLIE